MRIIIGWAFELHSQAARGQPVRGFNCTVHTMQAPGLLFIIICPISVRCTLYVSEG